MYGVSLVLLLAAIVTLAVGFVQEGLALIFVSIAASVASAAFLIAGLVRGRPLQPAGAGGAVLEREAVVGEPAEDHEPEAPSPPETELESSHGLVVCLPARGTYHRADCRFVKGRTDTEAIERETAIGRGYTACGVCRPG